jgi:hypothetical protein
VCFCPTLPMPAYLSIEALTMSYGGTPVLDGVSLAVGPNGAFFLSGPAFADRAQQRMPALDRDQFVMPLVENVARVAPNLFS